MNETNRRIEEDAVKVVELLTGLASVSRLGKDEQMRMAAEGLVLLVREIALREIAATSMAAARDVLSEEEDA